MRRLIIGVYKVTNDESLNLLLASPFWRTGVRFVFISKLFSNINLVASTLTLSYLNSSFKDDATEALRNYASFWSTESYLRWD